MTAGLTRSSAPVRCHWESCVSRHWRACGDASGTRHLSDAEHRRLRQLPHAQRPRRQPIADRELAGASSSTRRSFTPSPPTSRPTRRLASAIGPTIRSSMRSAMASARTARPSTAHAIEYYRNLSDSDVRAIVAYLRTVKPIKNKTEKSTYKIPLPAQYGPTVTGVPNMPRTDKVAYGRYLATALGHCMDCHTPMVNGRSDMTKVAPAEGSSRARRG